MIRVEFSRELENIHKKISEMGRLTMAAIGGAVEALVDMDADKARQIISQDDVIDNMEREIDQMCVALIARQQPVAGDLRDTISTSKLITDLERIADHASDISEKVILLSSLSDAIVIPADLIRMSDLSQYMIRGALESYVAQDDKRALEVIHTDDKVDALYDKVKKHLAHRMKSEPESIEIMLEILLVCKYFERISDHAQNVAEWVIFYLQGRRVES